MMVVVNLRKWGPSLTGRNVGAEVRFAIEQALQDSEQVTLDWSGVETATHSFCDEVVGLLFSRLGPIEFKRRLRFTNVESDTQVLLKAVIHDRLHRKVEPITMS